MQRYSYRLATVSVVGICLKFSIALMVGAATAASPRLGAMLYVLSLSLCALGALTTVGHVSCIPSLRVTGAAISYAVTATVRATQIKYSSVLTWMATIRAFAIGTCVVLQGAIWVR